MQNVYKYRQVFDMGSSRFGDKMNNVPAPKSRPSTERAQDAQHDTSSQEAPQATVYSLISTYVTEYI